MSASGLGQRAMSGQLVPFLPDDFYDVVDKISRSPDRLVLYGPTPIAVDKAMRAQCRRVAELAEFGSKAAEFCFTQYKIDPLQTVNEAVVA